MRRGRGLTFFLIAIRITSLFMLYWLGADALAEFACRSGGGGALRLASCCFPCRAAVFFRRGLRSQYDLEDRDFDRAMVFYEKALKKNPFYAGAWYQLAVAGQCTGRQALAERAMENYEALGPENFSVFWNAAVFRLSYEGASGGAAADMRKCLVIEPASGRRVYGLARLMGLPDGFIMNCVLPRTENAYSDYLVYLVKLGGANEALSFWRQAGRGLISPGAACGLCRMLVAGGRPDAAWKMWQEYTGADSGPADGAVIVNGGFDDDIKKDSCFGWIADMGTRAVFSYDGGGGERDLHVRFDGGRGSWMRVWQPVIVVPGRSYELSAVVKTAGVITACGLYLDVSAPECGGFYARSQGARGTSPWNTLSVRFRVPDGCRMLYASITRDRPFRLDPAGPSAVWVRDVRISTPAIGDRAAPR